MCSTPTSFIDGVHDVKGTRRAYKGEPHGSIRSPNLLLLKQDKGDRRGGAKVSKLCAVVRV